MNGHSQSGPVIHTLNAGLGGVLVSQWLGWLPPFIALLASFLAIVLYSIQIWESRTVQRWRRAAGWPVPIERDEA